MFPPLSSPRSPLGNGPRGRAKALHPSLCGSAAQGHTDKYGALETLGEGPRVSVAFVPKVAARQRTSRLAGLVWIPC